MKTIITLALILASGNVAAIGVFNFPEPRHPHESNFVSYSHMPNHPPINTKLYEAQDANNKRMFYKLLILGGLSLTAALWLLFAWLRPIACEKAKQAAFDHKVRAYAKISGLPEAEARDELTEPHNLN